MTQRWQHREISNFEYLMFLNTIAGNTNYCGTHEWKHLVSGVSLSSHEALLVFPFEQITSPMRNFLQNNNFVNSSYIYFKHLSMVMTALNGLLIGFQTGLFLKWPVEQMPLLLLTTSNTNGQFCQFLQSVIKSEMPGYWQILFLKQWKFCLTLIMTLFSQFLVE